MADQRTVIPASTVSSATTAVAANIGRIGFHIQNSGTNPLFVSFGTPAVNNSTYHVVLKGGTAAYDGNGGAFSMLSQVCYTGAIYTSGTGATYTVLEI